MKKGAAKNIEPAARRLPVLLRRAWFGLNQAFRRQIAEAGLTPGQFTALRTLIERETHERDRRANRLHVTAAGKRKFTSVRPKALDLQARVLNVLPESEREKFLESLERIADACQAELTKNL